MKRIMLVCVVTLATASWTPVRSLRQTSPAAEGFARLAALAGTWAFRDSLEAGNATGRVEVETGVVAYDLVSNGTTIMERVSGPGREGANMVSMIRLDGDRLVMDHYCSSGTQPRLVSPGLEGDVIRFTFAGGTGMPSAVTGHIHAATFTFGPRGTFESRWTWREPGNTHVGVRRHDHIAGH